MSNKQVIQPLELLSAPKNNTAPALPLFHSGGSQPSKSGAHLDAEEPATGRTLALLQDADVDDLEVAVQAAVRAQKVWAAISPAGRADALMQLAERVEACMEELGELDARDTGNPLSAMRTDVLTGVKALRRTAGLAHELKGHTIPVQQDELHYTALQPWGVVARIIAFNHPALYTCSRLAPALMAGNAVILKPSELGSITPLAIGQLAQDIFPEGTISVLTGGPQLGAAIAESKDLRRLSFTGGISTALKVATAAASSGLLKTVTYELGGKNPIVVFPDADLEKAASAVVRGMNFTRVQGQSCGSTSRLLAHEDIHDELINRVVEKASAIRVGPPTDPATEMGCLVNHDAKTRCVTLIDQAIEEGARLALDGRRPEDSGLEGGPYVAPTVLADVDPKSQVAQNEIFGPVLVSHRWTDVDQAIEVANDVRYGLTAAVWSSNISAALRTVERLEAGYVWVNDVETRYPAVPFGGWKDSGSGLEHGLEEILSFAQTKSVNVSYR